MALKRDKYDKAVSDYVRHRDHYTCRRCTKYFPEGRRQGLHCSHYFGRAAKGTRYEPDNCDALCHGCHTVWAEKDREDYREFKIKQLGEERFDELRRMSKRPKKWKKAELEAHRQALLDEMRERDAWKSGKAIA